MKSHILVCFHVLMLLWVFGGCDPAESSLENPEGTEDASEESGLPDRFSLSGELEGGGSPEIEGGEEESSGEEGGDSNSNPTGGGDLPDNPDNGEACSPFCVGVVCGDDGCGGSCGSCPGERSAKTEPASPAIRNVLQNNADPTGVVEAAERAPRGMPATIPGNVDPAHRVVLGSSAETTGVAGAAEIAPGDNRVSTAFAKWFRGAPRIAQGRPVDPMAAAERVEPVRPGRCVRAASAPMVPAAPRTALGKPVGRMDAGEPVETVLRAVPVWAASVRRILNAFPTASGRTVGMTDVAPCAGSAGRGPNA